MGSVSVAEVQELVSQLPEDKLPHAFRLLRDLVAQQGNTSLQVEFMRPRPQPTLTAFLHLARK